MIAYFTLLVGEHCNHMMINMTLDHKHQNVLMIVSFFFFIMPHILTSL